MSKIALISDVHGNLMALQKAIKTLEEYSPDIWICLGDLVGYGPFPKECIDLVRSKEMYCVLGNHDAGVIGKVPLRHFRKPNRTLIELTKKLISEDDKKWLASLPYTIVKEDWIAVHASPIKPERWEYIESAFTARNLLNNISQKFCFVGHTHKPVLVSDKIGNNEFKTGNKYLINPGSIGQSRDGDYRASCAFIDTKDWTYENIRISFDIEPVLTSLVKLGFSRNESQRLMYVSA
jgi:putative phosphoesterase